MAKTLRLILGDQLNHEHSWFKKVDNDVHYVMMEVLQETDYVQHHIQKVVAFFSAMRAFCQQKSSEGHQFYYLTLNSPENQQTIDDNLLNLIKKHDFQHFEYQLPDEYRLDQQLKQFCQKILISTQVYDTEHFLTKRSDLGDFFKGKKQFLMESFYRMMRQKYQILMNNGEPEGGKWNFDSENRKRYDNQHKVPQFPNFKRNVDEILQVLEVKKVKTIGWISKEYYGAITRQEALEYLHFFVSNALQHFGTYQDAMDSRFPYLFHSRLSFALNVKLLHPLEVVNAAIDFWNKNPEKVTLPQIEGFVRQIIGWREYMRGIYWLKMPDYQFLNFFNHQRKLPDYFWTGKTKMLCVKDAVQNSLQYAYAHHIQRLMITGNFALLAGIHPDEVDAWYLGIYMDAIQWVEITNTRGMSQYADGGMVGTKPYVSSANYIDKMSNYCNHCQYDKKIKYGKNACPFNSLYWHFYHRNRSLLENNPRIAMMFKVLDKMSKAELQKILAQAEKYLLEIEEL
ncbi:MAG: cryptochrome/photolyase family protein [Flammeovirgaceae bacterium]